MYDDAMGNVMERLRKRGRRLGAVLLPLLTFAWLHAAAGTCVSMPAEAAALAGSGAATKAAVSRHGDSGHQPAVASLRAGPSVFAAPPHAGSSHDHAAPAEHPNCPHCPDDARVTPHTPPPHHVVCDTADAAAGDVLSKTQPGWDGKLQPLSLPRLYSVPATPAGAAVRLGVPDPPSPCGSALTIRYCVFLL